MSSSSASASALSFLRIVDLIPESDSRPESASRDVDQNSEPSIAVNPVDPRQMFAGAFDFNNNGASPFFVSTDAGATWSIFGSIAHHDKSIAWKADGSGVLVAVDFNDDLDTYSATVPGSGFGAPINHYTGSNDNDQPWIRTGPSNHVYVGFNDDGASAGKESSVNVSTDGGSTYRTVTIDRVGGANGDSPATRIAVNGSRVYAIFNRYGSVVESDANGERFNSEIVVVRSDNGGADDFKALGTSGNGVTIATPISIFTDDENTHLTLGQERIGSDIAIAVDPNNANHVVVVYGDAPGANDAGIAQLVLKESTDGGATWSQEKYRTPSSVRSALPGLAILPNGAIGLLYASYDPVTNVLSQHLLTTTDDSTNDITLARQTNSLPTANGDDPYIGDFFDLTSRGNTFYGIFSASNADDGTNALFQNVTFNRDFTGTPGTSSFRLTDATGNAIPFSIDPFFFSYPVLISPAFASPTFQLSAFGTSAGGWSSNDTYPRALADVSGDGMADIVGFSSAGVYESLATGGGGFAMPTFELAAFGTMAGGWSSNNTYPRALADVNGDTRADIIAFSSAGVYESLATAGGHFAAPTFELAAFGTDAGGWSSNDTYPRELADVNLDGRADIIGFGAAGVYESLATAGGHFAAPTFELAAFGTMAGGWSSDNTYPREVADVNGDGRADIVGFGADGVYVSLNTGGGHFAAPTFELAAFGTNAGGWSSQDLYPRTLADVNADGLADIVGFGADGVSVSLATTGGHFSAPTFQLPAFGSSAGGWNSDNTFPRQLADITGDGKADIVGFATNGVWTSTSSA
jgi:FG-GAP-like repeat